MAVQTPGQHHHVEFRHAHFPAWHQQDLHHLAPWQGAIIVWSAWAFMRRIKMALTGALARRVRTQIRAGPCMKVSSTSQRDLWNFSRCVRHDMQARGKHRRDVLDAFAGVHQCMSASVFIVHWNMRKCTYASKLVLSYPCERVPGPASGRIRCLQGLPPHQCELLCHQCPQSPVDPSIPTKTCLHLKAQSRLP
jgi:hypothetical protein